MTAARISRKLEIALISFMLVGQALGQDHPAMGTHRLMLVTPGGELPFDMSLTRTKEGQVKACIINGSERIAVPTIQLEHHFKLSFTHYDSTLSLHYDIARQSLAGEWIKRRGKSKETRMQVISGQAGPRFTLASNPATPVTWPKERYIVQFEKSLDPAIGTFAIQLGEASNCTGTFLTTLGDYRFLAGNTNGLEFRLSCFDGAHAFLFHGRRSIGDSIDGDFWSSDSWHETWSAEPDEQASLPDGWNLTKWRKDARLSKRQFQGTDGKWRSLTDKPFGGTTRIIEVFGSWCPNCHDHGAFMSELHQKYSKQGLQVIGLAFEHDDNFERCVERIKTFARRHGATFPILIGGLSNKGAASKSLGLLDKVRSFPTTIFIDKDDKVRGIYQGWSGPATGDTHQRLRQRFEELIQTMLGEQ